MKKLALSTILTLMFVLMLTTSASAAVTYYHGNFATDSTGCARCHVTHAADVAALLVGTDGASQGQTAFCYYCHNDITKVPYNAKMGAIAAYDATGTTPTVWPSLAGGFAKAYNFDTNTYDPITNDSDAKLVATTSVHGVQTYDGNVWNSIGNASYATAIVPGGSAALGSEFRCGSCHNPHKGGPYTAGTNMPRLLRDDILTGGETVETFAPWTFENAGNDGILTAKTVGKYGKDISAWCAGCHNLFNKNSAGQGKVPTAESKYMHRMDFKIPERASIVAGYDNEARLALGSDGTADLGADDYLTCLTCHRAHGTSTAVNNSPNFKRYASYLPSNGSGTTTTSTSNSTVLLRLKDRDVCYKCHLEATANKPS